MPRDHTTKDKLQITCGYAIYQNQCASRKRIHCQNIGYPSTTTYVYKSYNILLGWHWKARAFITVNWFPMVDRMRRDWDGIFVPLVHCFCLPLTSESLFTIFASLRIFLVTSHAFQILLATLQICSMDLKLI